MAEDQDERVMRDIASRIGEKFPDYVLMVRVPNGFLWKHSDATWAIGACERYTHGIIDQAMLDEIDSRDAQGE